MLRIPRPLVDATESVVYRMNADWTELQIHGPGFLTEVPSPRRDWMELFIEEDDRSMVRAAIAKAREARSPFELEHRVRRADGSMGWTYSRAVPVFGADGEIAEWVGFASDVTVLKETQFELENQRRHYEAILNNTPDLAYVWDLNHRFIYANEGLLAMWGRSRADAIGKHCLELGYEPWHAAMHDREIDQVVATRQPVRGQVPFDGTFGRRIYDYLLVPVIGPDGTVEAVAGTTRDVTEIYELQNSLREADRRKDEFLATLAHELRNPLAPIRTAAELLNEETLRPPETKRLRDIVNRQVLHMVRLVDDLLDVSRITRGEIQLKRERTSLRRTLDDALEGVADSVRSSQHELVVDLPERLPAIYADATRLTQVFQNLLENAAKYTPSGGRITLTSRVEGGSVRVSVRDTGVGIARELQSRVFDLFTRLEPGEGLKTAGLGIGLALAKRLVEMHGGRLEVFSAGSGLGSEFVVTLPDPGVPVVETSRSEPVSKPSAPALQRRVLIADDNQDAALSLAMLLQATGCSVRSVFDGPSALIAVNEFNPDVAILDIGMPGMDGYQLAAAIRRQEQGRRTRLIALTGWGQDADRRRALDAGFDEHVTKPVDPARLPELLQENHP
ncbi:MAG: ATP-binding protein [Steroidobacteraceae bacterium]